MTFWRLAHKGRGQSDAVERPEQRSQHQTRSPCLERPEVHRFGIEPVERVARMRSRKPQPCEQFGAMPIVPQEVERRAIGEPRNVGDAVSLRHQRAVVARGGETVEVGARLAIDRPE